MKVLIAGGAGFIGSTVASACLDSGITPVIVDNLVTGRVEFVRDRVFYEGDIADGALIDRIFADHPDIAAVVHAAALIVVPESVAEPVRYYRENVAKSLDLISHVTRNGCDRYLFSSSASIYAPGADFTVDESSALRPESPYARTKAVMEWVLEDCTNAYDLRVDLAALLQPDRRGPEDAHGPAARAADPPARPPDHRPRGRRGVPDHRHRLADQRRQWHPRLHPRLGPGPGPRRGPAPVRRRAAGRRRQRYDVLNLGTGTGTTVREFVAAFQRVADRPLRVSDAPSRPGDVVGSYTRTDKAHTALDWTPDYTVEDGIRHSLEWATLRPTVLGE